MVCYAQLNEEGICIGVSRLSGTIGNLGLIPILDMDTSLVGKKYTNGIWEEVEQLQPPLSELEQTTLEIALNTEYLICLAELDM